MELGLDIVHYIVIAVGPLADGLTRWNQTLDFADKLSITQKRSAFRFIVGKAMARYLIEKPTSQQESRQSSEASRSPGCFRPSFPGRLQKHGRCRQCEEADVDADPVVAANPGTEKEGKRGTESSHCPQENTGHGQ